MSWRITLKSENSSADTDALRIYVFLTAEAEGLSVAYEVDF